MRVLYLLLFYAGLAVLYALGAGRDVNWDLLNYHLYSGLAFEQNRALQDFMPASMQSYLNPLANLPFYYLNKWGVSAPVEGGVLALLASLNLFLLHEIGRLITPGEGWRREVMCLLGALLGALSPIYLCELGTSFVDVLVAVPVLGAVLLCLYACCADKSRNVYLLLSAAGCCAGFALGLKLTSLLAVFAIGVVIAIDFRGWAQWGTRNAVFWLGVVLAFLLINGTQMHSLWERFGNPFFPFFNDFFKSNLFKIHGHAHLRFVPSDMWEFLLFPINIAGVRGYFYTEIISPDIRLFVLFALVVCAFLFFYFGFVGVKNLFEKRTERDTSAVALMVLVGVNYLFWLKLSGNGRYAVPLLLLLGPLIVAISIRLLKTHSKAFLFVACVMGVQAFVGLQAAKTRWGGLAWQEKWLTVDFPNSLRQEPTLYLSLQSQSLAFLSNFVNSGSGFVNLIGQQTIFANSAAWQVVDSLIGRYPGHVRTLYIPDNLRNGRVDVAKAELEQNAMLSRYGLTTDTGSCDVIRVPGAWGHPNIVSGSHGLSMSLVADGMALSCKVGPVGAAVDARDIGFQVGSMFAQQFASKCSTVIGRESAEMEIHDGYYRQFYSDSDARVEISLRYRSVRLYDYRGWVGSISFDSLHGVEVVPFCGKYEKFLRVSQ